MSSKNSRDITKLNSAYVVAICADSFPPFIFSARPMCAIIKDDLQFKIEGFPFFPLPTQFYIQLLYKPHLRTRIL